MLIQHMFLGFYDGHGGAGIADKLSTTLHAEIERDGGFRAPASELPSLLTNTFLRYDKELCRSQVNFVFLFNCKWMFFFLQNNKGRFGFNCARCDFESKRDWRRGNDLCTRRR
jgi:hypothetical protein